MNEVPIRPLHFVRIRVYRGGQAEYLSELLHEERKALLEDLSNLRTAGKLEDDPEIEEVREKIVYLINVLRDLDASLIQLAGPDEDPRP